MARAAKQSIQIDMPTNTLEHVLITTSTYTFLQADIEAFKVFIIDASITNCTITIPATTLTGLQFINLIQESAGTITIIPAETVNQQQYVSTSLQNISLISRTANVWNLYRGDVTVSAFTNAVTGVEVIPATITIDEAGTTQLAVEFTPANATDQTGTWSTNDALVATVSSSGLVTGVAAGSATITFTSTDGSFTDTCVVTVEAVVANLILNGTFDNIDNIGFGGAWSVANGIASYNYTATSGLGMDLSANLIAGNSYTLTFQVLNATTNGRALWREEPGNQNLNGMGITSYADNNYSITFTAQSSLTTRIGIVAYSSFGSIFSIDNVTLIAN